MVLLSFYETLFSQFIYTICDLGKKNNAQSNSEQEYGAVNCHVNDTLYGKKSTLEAIVDTLILSLESGYLSFNFF